MVQNILQEEVMAINKEKLKDVIDQIEEGTIAILLHRTPDSDAMGSGIGWKLLLSEVFERSSEIYYHGQISHPQNKAMKNVLHIPVKESSELDSPVGVVLVDSVMANSGFDLEADIRIDHHCKDKNGATYCDIRPVGSCCSIVWSYLKEYEINLEEHSEVATALVLGIETDTQGFTTSNTTDLDYEAYGHLLPYINKADLAKVKRFTLPKIQYEKEKIAYENLEIQGSIATSFIGEVNEHNRDVIPQIADKFSRMEAVSTVVVLGVIDNYLVASVRSEDIRHDVATLCTKAFGKDFSGAKEGSGGARVPLGIGFDLMEPEFKTQAIEEAIKGFRTRILEALGE